MNQNDEQNLHLMLLDAFESCDTPVSLSGRDNEEYIDKEDVEYFRGRDRWALPNDSLIAGSYAIYNFTDEAFIYFLPGFLRLLAKNGFTDSLLMDQITGGADGTYHSTWRKLSRMNEKQKEAFFFWIELFESERPERKWLADQIRERLVGCASGE